MDYSQTALIEKIQQYLDIKNASGYSLPFNLKGGICGGLVAYWLYSMANDEEGRFVDKIEYALQWDADKFKKSSRKSDLKLEELINVVFLLHYPSVVNYDIDQFNLDLVFPILLNSNQASVLKPEFKITFSFNQQALCQLIDQCFFPNKMIRLGNGLHAIGLFYHEQKYSLYDPECKDLIQYFDNSQPLAKTIFNIFAGKASVKDYIAMNATIFALEGLVKQDYPNPVVFCNKLLDNPVYKRDVLEDKYVFNVCAKYDEYALLDLLFAHGYRYHTKLEISLPTELNNAVLNHDLKKIQYLLNHDVPVDYKSKFGMTPLNLAIKETSLPMMYALLSAGANPNGDSTYLSAALNSKFRTGIILLLAFGMNLLKKDIERIKETFENANDLVQDIFEKSIILNEKIFKLPKQLDLASKNSKDIIKLLHNAKLRKQLGYDFNDEFIDKIKENYQKDHLSENFTVTEKEDVYETLKYFYPKMKEFNKDSEESEELRRLAGLLQEVTAKITSKNITEHSKSDLLEIQIILEKIAELKASTDQELSQEASEAEDKIREYLENNKVQSIPHKANNLFFILNKPEDKLQAVYEEDIEPLLSNSSPKPQ